MLPIIRFAYMMAVRRVLSGWRLESVLFGGILLAVALMASGVIFSDLLSNASLRHELLQATPEEANISMRSFSSQDESSTQPGRREAYQERLDFAQQNVSSRLGSHIKEELVVLDTATFYFEGQPNLEFDNDTRVRGSVIYMSSFGSDRVTLTQGNWPSVENAGVSNDTPMEVVVDDLGLDLLGVGVGDVVDIFPAASYADPPRLPVRISGVFERVDQEDEFWYGVEGDFSLQNDRWTIVPMFTSEEAVVNRVLGEYPTLYTDVTWFYYLDREGIRAADVKDLQNALFHIENDVAFKLKNSSSSIRLDNLLDSFGEQLVLARVPLFLVVFLITGILLYYLALVSGLVVRSRTSEIAMLKSRGATTTQIGILGLGEGLLLGIPAVIIGPWLAMVVVKVLGNVFFGLGGGADEVSGVSVTVSQGAVVLGLIGGALAVLVFTVATVAAARHGIVEARQSGARPPTASFLHRYYLDVIALGLILLIWFQARSRGAFLIQSPDSTELRLDLVGLLIPALLLLAVGLVIMRVFPWVIAFLSRLSEPVAPLWLVHSLRHLAREPMVPGILIVLLTMSTALGVIGSSFSSTLERNQRERALYEAGADLRVRHTGISSTKIGGRLAKSIEQDPRVLNAANVFRANGQITSTGFSDPAVVMAVDSSRFSEVAWFRDDLAGGKSMDQMAEQLGSGTELPEGLALPSDIIGLSVWVQPTGLDGGANLWARLRDAEGVYFDTWVGSLGNQGWYKIQSDLTPAIAAGRRVTTDSNIKSLSPPYTLQALQITNRLGGFGTDGLGAVFLADLEAMTPNGPVTITDFESPGDWSVVEDFSRPGLYGLETSKSASGMRFPLSTRFSWASGGVGLRGLRPGPTEDPIPAVVNSEFLELADASLGEDVIVGLSTYAIRVNIAAVADYFPTLNPGDKPFAVLDLDSFEAVANLHSPVPLTGANEIWVDLESFSGDLPDDFQESGPDQDADKVVAFMHQLGVNVRDVHDAEAMVISRVDQPLVNAGWGALLVLLFLAVALATGSGVMLFSFLDVKERQTEFALLRTLGNSAGQIQGIVWFNLFLIVICGLALGTWVGQLIGSSLLPLMELAEEGERVTPPMRFTVDGLSLLVPYAVLAGVTAITAIWLAWLSAKIQVQQVLRMGDAG